MTERIEQLEAALADMVAALLWEGAQGDGIDEWLLPQFHAACAALGLRVVPLRGEDYPLRFRVVWPARLARLVTVRGYHPTVE
jgi:hypothetical protein